MENQKAKLLFWRIVFVALFSLVKLLMCSLITGSYTLLLLHIGEATNMEAIKLFLIYTAVLFVIITIGTLPHGEATSISYHAAKNLVDKSN